MWFRPFRSRALRATDNEQAVRNHRAFCLIWTFLQQIQIKLTMLVRAVYKFTCKRPHNILYNSPKKLTCGRTLPGIEFQCFRVVIFLKGFVCFRFQLLT